MSRLEIGIGAIVAGLASMFADSEALNVALLILGALLVIHGAYQVYVLPNLWLDKTLSRWLRRRNFRVESLKVDKKDFYFGVRASDDVGRSVLISREKNAKGILAFSAKVQLSQDTISRLSRLRADVQQGLYLDIHILLASMQLSYDTTDFLHLAVQTAIPIDENLTEHSVDVTAKAVTLGYAATRSLIQKAVL
jgi:hypothetical protein